MATSRPAKAGTAPVESDFFKETWVKIKDNRPLSIICITGAIVVTVAYVVLAVWMAVLAFGGKDPEHCFYIMGLDKVHSSAEEVSEMAAK